MHADPEGAPPAPRGNGDGQIQLTPAASTPDASTPDAAMPDAAMPDAVMPDAATTEPIRRGSNGRFVKGMPSPNPKGPPRKPQLGPLTERMQRKRTYRVNGRKLVETDRDRLDRVVFHAAAAGSQAALKLRDERLAKEAQEAHVRDLMRSAQENARRRRELGLPAQEDPRDRDDRHEAMSQVVFKIQAAFGNVPRLRDRLIALGAIKVVDGRVEVSSWVKRPDKG